MARPIDGSREQFWRRHLERQPLSGSTIRGYCRTHGLQEPAFYVWRRTIAIRDRLTTPKAAGTPTQGGSDSDTEYDTITTTESSSYTTSLSENVVTGSSNESETSTSTATTTDTSTDSGSDSFPDGSSDSDNGTGTETTKETDSASASESMDELSGSISQSGSDSDSIIDQDNANDGEYTLTGTCHAERSLMGHFYSSLVWRPSAVFLTSPGSRVRSGG